MDDRAEEGTDRREVWYRQLESHGGPNGPDLNSQSFGHLPLTSCTRLSCCDLSRLLRSASRSLTRFAATVMASAAASNGLIRSSIMRSTLFVQATGPRASPGWRRSPPRQYMP